MNDFNILKDLSKILDKNFLYFDYLKKDFWHISKDEVIKQKTDNSLLEQIEKHLSKNGFIFKTKKGKHLVFLRVKEGVLDGFIILQALQVEGFLLTLLEKILNRLISKKTATIDYEREVNLLRDELEECESTVSKLDKQLKELEEVVDDYKLQIEGLEESVSILRNSRSKMLKLIDGIKNPLFSLTIDYELNNVNKALGDLVGVESLAKFIGNKCFKAIFNFNEKCPWCKLDKVITEKEEVIQNINVKFGENEYWFEHVMFPIFNENGEVVEVGELLNDITEQYKLYEDLKNTQYKIKKISKDRIDALNEVAYLKKEYNDLYHEYEKISEKHKKLISVFEKIINETKAGEVLTLRKENRELKYKLGQLNQLVEKLNKKLEESRKGEKEIYKKTIYSIDRLYNMITKRVDFKKDEYEKTLQFISTQLELIKDKLGI